jgi:hypothetical protein
MRFNATAFAAIVVALAVSLAAQPVTQGNVGLPREVVAACDAVHAVVAKTPGTKQRRRTASFADEMLRAPIAACRIEIDGSMKSLGTASIPTDDLAEYFEAQKWDQLPEFSTDGHDGTSFAYQNNGAGCLVRGHWDGGSDDDPNAPTADPYTVIVLCGRVGDFVRPQAH